MPLSTLFFSTLRFVPTDFLEIANTFGSVAIFVHRKVKNLAFHCSPVLWKRTSYDHYQSTAFHYKWILSYFLPTVTSQMKYSYSGYHSVFLVWLCWNGGMGWSFLEGTLVILMMAILLAPTESQFMVCIALLGQQELSQSFASLTCLCVPPRV